MGSEITHKAAFSPLKYLGWLAAVGVLAWLFGVNHGIGLAPETPPADAMRPCPAVMTGPLPGA